jgi:hypothetical protein
LLIHRLRRSTPLSQIRQDQQNNKRYDRANGSGGDKQPTHRRMLSQNMTENEVRWILPFRLVVENRT